MQSRAAHRCPKAQGCCRECSRALGVTNALQRRHPLAAGKHPYARKASTASATGGHLSRSTPSSTRPSNAAEETITVIRRYAMPNALPHMMTSPPWFTPTWFARIRHECLPCAHRCEQCVPVPRLRCPPVVQDAEDRPTPPYVVCQIFQWRMKS